MKKKLLCAVFLLSVLILSKPVFGQFFSSPNVPIGDPIYREIDKLIAFGFIKDSLYGQRPWSRSEIARMIEEARVNAKVGQDKILARLKKDFVEGEYKTLQLHPLEQVDFDYTLLESPYRTVPMNNGLGSIDAAINPLVAYREGRHYVDGSTLELETSHSARLTKYFSFYARPHFEILTPDTGPADFNPIVQQLYGKFQFWNVALEVGRDSLIWGQGELGGVLFSNNARPFDMLKLSNDSPFLLPWIFKYFGPVSSTFFVANLGPEREFPYSYLTGLKISVKPASFFEMGVDHIMVLGGNGAPGPISPGAAISEFFFVRSGNINTTNIVNHELGLDFRFFLPMLRNSQIYLDMQLEDRELGTPLFMFTDLMNYQTGFYIPRLTSDGNMDLRLEYRHGSPFFYRHGVFSTGMAMNRRMWGDELGPDGDGVYISFSDELSEKQLVKSSLRYERRSGDTLSQTENPDSTHRHLTLVTSGPTESRIGWDIGGSYKFRDSMHIGLNLGYERVSSFNFVSGNDRNDFLGTISLEWKPGF